LANLVEEAAPEQRYSYSFNGNAQAIDHALATQNLLPFFTRLHYARANADFPETFRSDPARPERISDHDPLVAYFKFTAVNRSRLSVLDAGETRELQVSAPTGCAWTATSNDAWLSILSGASGNGNGAVTFRANFSTLLDTRAATLNIAGRAVPVSQTGTLDFCVYRLETTFLEGVSANGGSGAINVRSACGWTAVSHNSWLRITSGASGSGNGAVTFAVEPNTNAGRGGTITVAGRDFIVKQNPR
jgi:hypothetical protein